MVSIEDQLRICREHASGGKLSIAITPPPSPAPVSFSGQLSDRCYGTPSAAGSTLCSPRALERIYRDQADMATLYKHRCFAGVKIITLAESEIPELHLDLKGTMKCPVSERPRRRDPSWARGRVEKGKAGGGSPMDTTW